MIQFTLIYQVGPQKVLKKVQHHVVPRVGEKVLPPDEDVEVKALSVLAVEHNLNDNAIYVVLN